MSTGTPENRTWIVTFDPLARHLVEAAYFKTEGDLTVFKDPLGAAVFAALTRRIVSIARQSADQPADAASIEASSSAITEADLDKAVETGVAKVFTRATRDYRR